MLRVEYWAGTETAFRDYQESLAKLSAHHSDEEPTETSYEVHGNVAVIPIKGSLTNRDSFWNSIFGLTSYTQIRNAVVEASSDSAVNSIVLDIDSGGGSASGVSEVGALIRYVHDNVKPVAAYSGGTMASAAYWIGASAGQVFSNDTATVGSIGVIATHMDFSKMLENDGIKATVFRAGEFKALGSPYEQLDEKATKQIQSQLDTLYGLFVDKIAQLRGVTPEVVLDKMAEGREFIGAAAKRNGLVDGITTLDTLVGKLQKRSPTAGKDSKQRVEIEDMARKKLLTPDTVAALAEGAPLDAVLETAPDATEEAAPVVVEGKAAEEAAKPGATAAPAPAAQEGNAIVDFLKSELSAKTSELVQVSAEKTDLQRQVDVMKASFDSMREIVAAGVNRMRIAMGGSAMDLSGLPAETLLQEHAKATKDFNGMFPVGGVAKLASTEEQDKTLSSASAGRIRAVRFK